ncbi:hypothetical protein [Nonomuraea indica]|uniref:hypothetical protein n=1 Tax=Nonomuraea indica TaxID=1581193 RepID=UPI000C7C00CF|nr:hypothetical protein [Nonomuraea indica]
MGIFSPKPGRRRREPPPGVVAAAADHPGGWVYAIDPDQVASPDGYVPPEAIAGAWRVGDDGRPTGEYEPNPRHGPVRDDFTPLTDPDHWLGWLGDDPAAAVRASIAEILGEQVPGSVLEWIKVLGTPEFLTGGRRDPDDPDKVVVVRAALALPFALSVCPPGGERSVLQGVFSWAAAGLDRPGGRRDSVWFDLGAGLEEATGLLRDRIYALDDPS